MEPRTTVAPSADCCMLNDRSRFRNVAAMRARERVPWLGRSLALPARQEPRPPLHLRPLPSALCPPSSVLRPLSSVLRPPPRPPVDAHHVGCYAGRVSGSPTLHIVLHQPEIPQNTGNISRTCVAIDAKLWLVRPLGFQLGEKQLRRAGLDYWKHLQWEVVDCWEDVLAGIPELRPWFFTKSAGQVYTTVRYRLGDTLIFGSETSGLPPHLLQLAPERNLRIPIGPHVRSLNLSNAVAVAAYEALRQTGFPISGLHPVHPVHPV